MEFLITLNASAISEKSKENSFGLKPRTNSIPRAEEILGSESNDIFTSTFNLSKTNIGGSEVLAMMQKQKIASRIHSSGRRKTFMKGSHSEMFDSTSSFDQQTPGLSPATVVVSNLVSQSSKEIL